MKETQCFQLSNYNALLVLFLIMSIYCIFYLRFMKKNTVEYVRKCRGGMKDCEHSMGQLQSPSSFNEGT